MVYKTIQGKLNHLNHTRLRNQLVEGRTATILNEESESSTSDESEESLKTEKRISFDTL